jgi:hypothetical protein
LEKGSAGAFILHSRKHVSLAVTITLLIGLSTLVFNFGVSFCSAAVQPVVINAGQNFTNSSTVTLNFDASSVFTTPAYPGTFTEMSVNNSESSTWTNWQPLTLTKTWILAPGDGLRNVYAKFRIITSFNTAVNPPSPIYQTSTIFQGNITVDTTPPMVTVLNPIGNGTQIDSSNLQVSWTTTDASSGIKSIAMLDPNGNFINVEANTTYTSIVDANGNSINVGANTTFTFSSLDNGDHTFSVLATDNVDNKATTSLSFSVNTSQPPPTPTSQSPSPTIPPLTPTSSSSSLPPSQTPLQTQPAVTSNSPSSTPTPTEAGIPLWPIIGAAIAGIAVVITTIGFVVFRRTKKYTKRIPEKDKTQKNAISGSALTSTTLSLPNSIIKVAGDLVDGLLGIDASSAPRVYYLGIDFQVHELAWWGDKWHHSTVSLDAGAPPAVIGSPLTATTQSSNLPRVYYLGIDFQVHELAWWGDKWHHSAVSSEAFGPKAIEGSPLTSTTCSNNPRVYYLAADFQVHELAWWGDKWHHRVVSSDAGGPQAIMELNYR